MSLALIRLENIRTVKEQAKEWLEKLGMDAAAIAERDKLIAKVQDCVKQVTNSDEQRTATASAKELKAWLKSNEELQTEINGILLPIQRKTRRLTDEANEPVTVLVERLQSMLTGFREAEDARVRREEAERQRKIREAQAETDRLNREAAERAQQLERDKAEAERKARAAEELARNAKTAKERKAAAQAQAEAEAAAVSQQALEEAAHAELEAAEAAERERAAILAKTAEASHVKGLVGGRRKRWCLEDDPEAIHRLYAANRSLVRIEPNAAAILAVCQPELPTPGLKVWWEAKTDIRS